ncbi:glycosyltransferase family 2 protein [Falsirhodobacter sp. 1013]|uniref:glycosyltransferase family 2 protein n=1 Tax=Falsirhodobacter sp. 1013 TaxID=3417566 RepID=UPI003EBFAF8A
MTERARIGSLWIGGPLSWMEIASIKSFLRLGHDYTLYTYEDVPNVPEGAHVVNAREVWDTDRILMHDKAQSPAIHADVFRVRMIAQEGNVWADTDVIALQPFPADLRWFIGHEREDRLLLGNAIMGLPADSQTLKAMMDFLTADFPIPPWSKGKFRRELEQKRSEGVAVRLESLSWGSTGPEALTWFAQDSGEIAKAQPTNTFFPVAFNDRKRLVKPPERERLEEQLEREGSLSVHLYSRWLRKYTGGMPGGLPPATSWLGTYLIDHDLADYDSLPAPAPKEKKPREAKDEKEQAERKATVKLDPDAFLNDLDARKAALPDGPNASKYGRITLVTMAKDEGPYVLEWVAYHHLLGFTDILAYTNDCTDGTDEMLDALAALGLVTRMENGPMRELPPQSRALKRATGHPLVKSSDYIMVMDFDEFLTIKTEGGDVNSLIDLMKETDTDAMAVTWRFFGSSHIPHYGPEPVTQRLTRAANDDFNPGYGVKTLFRKEDYLRLAIHRPRAEKKKPNPRGLPWINGSAKPIDGNIMTWRQTRQSKGYDFAQVNHYGVKTHEEYLMRRLRGDVLNNHDKYNIDYFRRFDRNEVEDKSATRHADRLATLMATLRQDPAVAAAEAMIRERYAAKLERLRTSEGYEEQMRELAIPSSIVTIEEV